MGLENGRCKKEERGLKKYPVADLPKPVKRKSGAAAHGNQSYSRRVREKSWNPVGSLHMH